MRPYQTTSYIPAVLEKVPIDRKVCTQIARDLQEIRTKAKLSQPELAKRMSVAVMVVCRMENPTTESYTIPMLTRFAAAVGRRVEVRFVPIEKKAGGGKD